MFIEIVKEAARQAVDAAMPVRILEAVVVSPPPALSIRLTGNQKLVIPADMLMVSERLTRFETGDRVLVFSVQGGQSYFVADRVVRYGPNA